MSEQEQSTAAEPSFREQVETAEATEPSTPEVDNSGSFAESELVEASNESPKFVPLGALHEERQKRKNAEAHARQQQSEHAQYQRQAQERLDYLHRLATQNQEPQREVPSLEDDPLSNIGATVHDMRQQMQQMRDQQHQERQEQQQNIAVRNFVSTVDASEKHLAKERPDYFEAVHWAKTKKAQEYVAVGFTEEGAWNRVQQEAQQIAIEALQRGESPAEVGYRLASAIGYKSQGNAEQRLEMQRNGRATSTPSGGSGHGAKLSLDALQKMSGDDFLSATSGDKWKKMMGGK